MGFRVSLHGVALLGQGAQILPGKRAAAPEEVRVDEQGGAEAVVLQDWARVLDERLVAVVEGEQDGLARQLPAPGRERYEVGQAEREESLGVQLLELGVESVRGDREPALLLRADVVVDQDRHELVAPGEHTDRIPFVLRDHDLLAHGERAGSHVVFDQPPLLGIPEVAGGQGFGRLAGFRHGHDEVTRLEYVRVPGTRPGRGLGSRGSRRPGGLRRLGLAGGRARGDGEEARHHQCRSTHHGHAHRAFPTLRSASGSFGLTASHLPTSGTHMSVHPIFRCAWAGVYPGLIVVGNTDANRRSA